MGKRKQPIMMRRPPKQKPPSKMSEKELRDKIAELEYERVKTPKFPDLRMVIRRENLTIQIKIYYAELEKRKKNGNKNNSES